MSRKIEANTLLGNEFLMGLLAEITESARDELVRLDASNTDAIRNEQAMCRAVDSLVFRLKIIAGQAVDDKDKPSSVA